MLTKSQVFREYPGNTTAQEITFNQDPEAGATDIEQEPESNCCCNVLCCPCKLFYWYISPITCELCHTLKCWFFHPFNFAFAIILFVWDVTMISVGIGLIALCCIGIPLLWIGVEFTIMFSRIDLAFNYLMVENGKKLDESRKHLLTLSLYFTNLPLCCCYNDGYENCCTLMMDRMKYLFTNWQIYKYILYHILFRPIFTASTWWMSIIVACNVAACGVPIWYLVNDKPFKHNSVVVMYDDDHCQWVDHGDYSSISCDKDYIWIINTFGRALLLGIISLLILPISMRINNWFACINKIVAYRFYTFYYSADNDYVRDKAPMLSNHVRIDSV